MATEKPKNVRRPKSSLGELIRYRELLYILTWRDIRIKYKQSVLGLLWAILMPMVIVLAGIVVKLAFSIVSKQPLTASEIASVSVKAVPWAFFVSSLRFGANCLIGNSNLVTKIYFPKLVLPISAVLSQLFDFLIASCVLAVVLLSCGLPITATVIWVPLLLLLLVAMATGITVVVSAASLFFRDVKYIVEIFLTFAIFFTPIFYEAEMFGRWKNVLLLNPVPRTFEGDMAAVVELTTPDLRWRGYTTLSTVLLVWGGTWLFHRLEPVFAESI